MTRLTICLRATRPTVDDVSRLETDERPVDASGAAPRHERLAHGIGSRSLVGSHARARARGRGGRVAGSVSARRITSSPNLGPESAEPSPYLGNRLPGGMGGQSRPRLGWLRIRRPEGPAGRQGGAEQERRDDEAGTTIHAELLARDDLRRGPDGRRGAFKTIGVGRVQESVGSSCHWCGIHDFLTRP